MNNTQCLNGGCLDEREAFEAYARRDGLNVTRRVVDDGLTYVALATENAWQIWQASRRSMPDTRFAAWCIELLTKAESRGLHLDADKQAILTQARASQSDGTSGGWQAIETAPEGVLLVVGWLDAEDEAHPERHDFDYLEDGVWQKHSENVEYFQACAPTGSRGPKEQAPYTHFMPVGSIPGAPTQGENHVG
ncbi:hypothetical protein GmRootV59_12530 [Variovorax sp. V59]|uniref:hypothetical protein n=1 Tax=unclassified Variovorax TaxID=663243 RepID=UPI0034E8C566